MRSGFTSPAGVEYHLLQWSRCRSGAPAANARRRAPGHDGAFAPGVRHRFSPHTPAHGPLTRWLRVGLIASTRCRPIP